MCGQIMRRSSIRRNWRGKIVALPKRSISKLAANPGGGQAAVAQIVLNRVSSGLYPATICGVVYQNWRHYNACQFSFACEGKSLRIEEPDAWRQAVRIAGEMTNGKAYVSDIGGSTNYHTNYVRPRWARRLEKMDIIGHHIFYKLRPGQS